HLTYTTILWCIGVLVFSYLAKYNIQYLWLVSLMLVLQYVTDLLDGEIGRRRNTGLIKWGFYMDHLLDYVFLGCLLIGYSVLLPDNLKYMQLYIMTLFGAFMVNSFLSFAATNEFKIAYLGIGPTELRLIFILVNTLIIVYGKTYLAMTLPYLLIASLIGFCITVYATQKKIWAIDMKNIEKTIKKK
ncbi:CDP-alcohol phosphatidyltransferase family protein, partial [Candidatus Woesearchaeota archaeon]|nr:CDP-alcohol phosphatidyltransferase family protein [Candidatus Woesearchaeota archaeon]